jgi:ABC-type glycerol-3-phosphate transport system substrate-binding protein
MLAAALALAGCRSRAATVPAYELVKWGSPRPISERVAGEKYLLPEAWKTAVAGVERLRVSNFGALRNDPATVANARRFQELTGIQVELLPWSEESVFARTLAILAAHSDTVDLLCYNHSYDYVLLAAMGSLQRIDALWNDPNVWKLFPSTLQKALTARDGHIYGSIGQARTDMLFYRPSLVPSPPMTWRAVEEAARRAARRGVWGYVFGAGGRMDILSPLGAMVYSQGGRMVDTGRERLVVDSPEGRSAWRMLADMVLVDRSAPPTVVDDSWMQAADAFALGRAAMVLTRAIDAGRFKDPRTAPGIRNDWAIAPPPKWDGAQPDSNMASHLGLDGYAINRSIGDGQKAAAMLFVDFMRSFEAAGRELVVEGNEVPFLAVYDSPAARSLVSPDARKSAMGDAVIECFPPGEQAFAGLVREYFARAVSGTMDPMAALEQLQSRLDDYAVPGE